MDVAGLFLAFVLGLFYLGTGFLKLTVAHENVRNRIGWVADVPPSRYRLAGWLEAAGGIGLMFPTMVEAFRWLTPIAALALAVVMVEALRLHLRRREFWYAMGTVTLALMLVFVAVSFVLASLSGA